MSEALSNLVHDRSTENLKKYESIVAERNKQNSELYGLYRTKWEDLRTQWIICTNDDIMVDELLRKFDSDFNDTLRFGGTRAFLEIFANLLSS